LCAAQTVGTLHAFLRTKTAREIAPQSEPEGYRLESSGEDGASRILSAAALRIALAGIHPPQRRLRDANGLGREGCGAQAPHARVPLANGTLVATSDQGATQHSEGL
jgi:hypothetical protein